MAPPVKAGFPLAPPDIGGWFRMDSPPPLPPGAISYRESDALGTDPEKQWLAMDMLRENQGQPPATMSGPWAPVNYTPPALANIQPDAVVRAAQDAQIGKGPDGPLFTPSSGAPPVSAAQNAYQNEIQVSQPQAAPASNPQPPQQDAMARIMSMDPKDMFLTLKSGSGSKTVTQGTVPKQMIPTLQKEAERQVAERKAILEEELAANAQSKKQISAMADRLSADEGVSRGRAEEAYQEWKKAGADLNDQRKALEAKQIDPNRLVASMPTWNKVSTALASAVGGYLEGYTRGQLKNTALEMLNRSIDQDIQIQKEEMGKQFQLLALSERQQSAMFSAFDKLSSERRSDALQVTKLQLAKMAMAAQDPQAKLKAADVINGINDQLNKYKIGSFDRTTKTSGGQSHQIVDPRLGALMASAGKGQQPMKPADPKLVSDAAAAQDAIDTVRGVKKAIADGKYSYAAQSAGEGLGIPFTDIKLANFNTESGRIVNDLRKQVPVLLKASGQDARSDFDIKHGEDLWLPKRNTEAGVLDAANRMEKKILGGMTKILKARAQADPSNIPAYLNFLKATASQGSDGGPQTGLPAGTRPQ